MFAVLIPCLNEAENILAVIGAIRSNIPDCNIIIIDDGSSDATAEKAAQAGADVISLPYNLGIGAAIQTGYIYALEHGFEAIVRLDGDGQHNPHDIFRLLEPINELRADMVIGSRFCESQGYTSSVVRVLGIRYFSAMISVLTGLRITDPTSGFYAVNKEALRFLARHTPIDYPEIESLILLARAGFRIMEIPTTMRPRTAGKSSIGFGDSLYYMLKVTLAIVIELIRRKPVNRQ